MKNIIFNYCVIFCFAIVACSQTRTERSKINGVNFVSPPNPILESEMKPIKELGADWVSIIPYAFTNPSEGQVSFGDEKGFWWGEKPSGGQILIEHAKKLGLKVMLKPHIWVLGQGWAGDLSFSTDVEWERWEKDYSKYILFWAKVAEKQACDLFCIGTEVRQSIKTRPEFWKRLILKIKSVYKGKLTYSANWDNYEYVSFWDEMDYIGIDAYFPLSDEETPSLKALNLSWDKLANELQVFSHDKNRPILFTEYGYRSISYNTKEPWQTGMDDSLKQNDRAQSIAYQAIFESIWNQKWFAGGFLWKWYPSSMIELRSRSFGFTPQGKETEDIIKAQYR